MNGSSPTSSNFSPTAAPDTWNFGFAPKRVDESNPIPRLPSTLPIAQRVDAIKSHVMKPSSSPIGTVSLLGSAGSAFHSFGTKAPAKQPLAEQSPSFDSARSIVGSVRSNNSSPASTLLAPHSSTGSSPAPSVEALLCTSPTEDSSSSNHSTPRIRRSMHPCAAPLPHFPPSNSPLAEDPSAPPPLSVRVPTVIISPNPSSLQNRVTVEQAGDAPRLMHRSYTNYPEPLGAPFQPTTNFTT